MKRTFTSSLALVMLASLSLSTQAAFTSPKQFDLSAYHYKSHAASAFKGDRHSRIQQINSLMYPDAAPAFAGQEGNYLPDVTLGPANTVGDLDGPNGENWFFTAFYDYDVTPPDYEAGIWFTNYILKSYRFVIYDEDANQVGSIQDTMRYQEDEAKTVYVDLTPVITRNFFNTDNKIEVAVALGINTTTPGLNHYRTLVYSLGGEKDADGNDKSFMSFPDLIADVAEGTPTADGRDNYYLTFATDIISDEEEPDEGNDDNSFWDMLTQMAMEITTYGRAEGDKGPQPIHTETIPLINLPGDQEGSPFMFNFTHDGKLWYLYSYLKEPLWERYDDPLYDDLIQRPDNNLQIFLYSVDGDKVALEQTTLIPTPKDESDEWAIASFYSVGDMRYKEDVVFNSLNQPEGKAAFYITRANYTPSSDSTTKSFYAYGHDGKQIYTYAEYCNSTLALSDLPGYEPQQMFVNVVGGQYQMTFVDLYSNKEAFSTPNWYYINDLDDPELIMANVDRTIVGDSYQYAFEMTYPVEMDDNVMLRVLWTNNDGSFNRIDLVNAGENVMYGQFYIADQALDPGVFSSDDEREYLFLIKRGQPGAVTSEEVCVAQPVSDANPDGKTLLSVGPSDNRVISGIVPYLYGEKKHLNIYMIDQDATTDTQGLVMDVYDLPLDKSNGLKEVVPANSSSLAINGTLVKAAGRINVYNAAGARVARAEKSIDLKVLPAGLYIVEADGRSVKVNLR